MGKNHKISCGKGELTGTLFWFCFCKSLVIVYLDSFAGFFIVQLHSANECIQPLKLFWWLLMLDYAMWTTFCKPRLLPRDVSWIKCCLSFWFEMFFLNWFPLKSVFFFNFCSLIVHLIVFDERSIFFALTQIAPLRWRRKKFVTHLPRQEIVVFYVNSPLGMDTFLILINYHPCVTPKSWASWLYG